MKTSNVCILEEYVHALIERKKHTENLFGVTLTVNESKCDGQNPLDFLVVSDNHGSRQQSLVCVTVSADSTQENVEKAKNYVESLTCAGDAKDSFTFPLEPAMLSVLANRCDDLERTTQAIFNVDHVTNSIYVFGKPSNVSAARSAIENMVIQGPFHLSGDSHVTYNPYSCGRLTGEESEKAVLGAQEDCVQISNSNVITTLNTRGGDSRTLHGEATDRVPDVAGHHHGDSKMSGDFPGSSLSYNAKVEFALKLGYTEDQLKSVITRMGGDIEQNELLSELMKIEKGQQSKEDPTSSSSDDDEEDDSGFSRLPQRLPTTECMASYGGLSMSDSKFRPIVIDGSNVAMSHGNKEVFSCRGIQLAVNWFLERGHKEITVFVPQWRKEMPRPDTRIQDQGILSELEKEKYLVFTPSRRIKGKRVVCYDDRYILNLAAETGGIVVSNDNYRDLVSENPEYCKVVEERLLMYSFVNDRFMPPDDPLGRHGPSLDNFLSNQPQVPETLPPLCPYGSKKCTYGMKCKFYHPERGNKPQKTITEKLEEQAKQKMQEIREKNLKAEGERKRALSRKTAVSRTRSLVTCNEPVKDKLRQNPLTDFGSLAIADPPFVSKEDVEKDLKTKLYNEKLAEQRRKMEQEVEEERKLEAEKKCASPEPEDKPFPFLSPNTSAICSPETRSRSSSPHQGLESPRPPLQQEQFLSGHLLLAKKLSDEAADKKMKQKKEEMVVGELGVTQYRSSSPLAQAGTYIKHSHSASSLLSGHHTFQTNPSVAAAGESKDSSSERAHPASATQQSPQKQPVKQKLSRQLSLQGAEDPRIQSGHASLRQYMSLDPRLVADDPSQPTHQRVVTSTRSVPGNAEMFLASNPEQSRTFHKPTQQAQQQQYLDPFCSGMAVEQHAVLSRLQSAPEVPRMSANPQQPLCRMRRQNSSSDTQIHMAGLEYEGEDPFQPNFAADYALYSNIGRTQRQGHQVQPASQPVLPGYSLPSQTVPQRHHAGNTTWTFAGQTLGPVQTLHPLHQRQMPSPMAYQVPPFMNTEEAIWNGRRQSLPGQMNPAQHGLPGYHYGNQGQQPMGIYPHLSQGNVRQPPISLPQGHLPLRGHHSTEMGHRPLTTSRSHHLIGHDNVMGHHPVTSQESLLSEQQKDNRQKVFFHLCALFPEFKVKEVMNKYPDVTDPEQLCAYIIGAK